MCLALLAVSAGSASAAFPSWPTYRHDAAQSGFDPDSGSPLQPSQLWQTPALDGAIYGQPLVYGARVYVATENDSVYALDASTGAVVWGKPVAMPVPEKPTAGCGNIGSVGFTGTPVIDPSTKRIFVVGATWDGSHASTIQHLLYGLNLADGSPAPGFPTAVDAPGSQPAYQLQRPGLALDAGRIVIGYGGHAGDCGPYHGWLVSVPEGGGPLLSFEVEASAQHGAIWASGNAPPVDGSGSIWAATGNGDPAALDGQESVLKLDSALHLLDHWTPANWSALDSGDADIGSSAPVLLPGGLIFQIGKSGIGYVLKGSPLADVFQAPVCSGSFGGGVYSRGVIYVACSDGIHALSLNSQLPSFAPLAGWDTGNGAIGPPIIAGGLVWSTNQSDGVLRALNPGSGKTAFSANLGGFDHFASPSAAGGRLFVANTDKVTAFTIANTPHPSPTSVALTSSPNPSPRRGAVIYAATVNPAPDAGTVSFRDGAAAITSCSAVPVSSSGQARCRAAYRHSGSHRIVASYSGDPYYAPSTSATLTELVTTPSISKLKRTTAGGTLTLTFTLPEPATLVVTIRKTHSRRRTTRRFRGLRGRNRLKLALKPASYTITLTARDVLGNASSPDTFRITIKRARKPKPELNPLAVQAL